MEHANTISDNFNKHSSGFLTHAAKHVLVMGAMMGVIAVASPAMAALPALSESATLGNLAVQTAYGSWEMLMMIGDTLNSLITIGGDLVHNTFSGDWAATTMDSAVMSHDSSHDMAMHGAEALHDNRWFDGLLRDLYASGGLGYAIEDSQALGISLEEHLTNEYGHEGH